MTPCVSSSNRIVAISPDGKRRRVIATSDTAPLGNPTSLVIRQGVLCAAFVYRDFLVPGNGACCNKYQIMI